jgi:hypothetical protein
MGYGLPGRVPAEGMSRRITTDYTKPGEGGDGSRASPCQSLYRFLAPGYARLSWGVQRFCRFAYPLKDDIDVKRLLYDGDGERREQMPHS